MEHEFRRLLCIGCGEQIDVPVYCGNRFCPVCSITRSIRVKSRLTHLVNSQVKIPGYEFYFWTFSLANQPDLAKAIKKLRDGFRKLRNRAYWKKKVFGGAFVIEITGKPGSWHPHIHCIIYSLYADWFTMLGLWKKSTGGRGVYVKRLNSQVVVNYLTKYLAKPDVPDDVEYQISTALKGTRLMAPIGLWHNANKSYKRTATPCRKCGGIRWVDWSIEILEFHRPLSKDFQIRPRPAPDVGRKDTLMLDRLL